MLEKLALVALANVLPTLEQVAAIPLGIALGLPLEYVALVSLIANPLIFFPVYFALEFFYEGVLSRIKRFNDYLLKVREKGKPYVDKYGMVGIALFVVLPTPFTGTYTATVLSWLLGLEIKKSFAAIVLGSALRTVSISLAAGGMLTLLSAIF